MALRALIYQHLSNNANDDNNNNATDNTRPAKAQPAPVEDQAFPTENALRQKEARKKQRESLERAGHTAEEASKITKRKRKQAQEDHHDDCGSDTEPIEEANVRSMLATGTPSLDDAVAYSFFDDLSNGSETEEEVENELRDTMWMNMLGSTVSEHSADYLKPHACVYVNFDDFPRDAPRGR